MTTRVLYERCVELDDDAPDDICPLCHQQIDGWEDYEAHYPPDAIPYRVKWNYAITVRLMPLPFTTEAAGGNPNVCPMTHDYLTARVHRRRLIREGITT